MDFKLKMALRDSKIASRPYVLVNPLLAKHLPISPSLSLDYFKKLGNEIAAVCKGEQVLVIGFAETATAVGAAVACAIPNAKYVHTTRESVDYPLVADFSEEHSHAKNQALYLRDEHIDLSLYHRLVFVEDEITTGRTILNFLKNIKFDGKITVSALVFNNFDQSVFSQYDADFFCLQKTGYVQRLTFPGPQDPRSGVSIERYHKDCTQLAHTIIATLPENHVRNRDILVMGTEEFMYPALILGQELERTAKSVKSQSTTRSPLLPQAGDDYPLYSRYQFPSVYDSERKTHIYNLERYDVVVILTDSSECNEHKLIEIIQNQGNQIIYYVRIENVC